MSTHPLIPAHCWLLLALSPALALAPATRVLKLTADQASPTFDYTLLAEASQHLMTPIGSIAAANLGPYIIAGFKALNCPGNIAILPLFRNAEGAHILRLLAQGEVVHGVIFKGLIYPQFPQFSYTVSQLEQKFKTVLGFDDKVLQPLAFAETGNCQLATNLALALPK
ncbi:MAG: hypothetical protein MJK10_06740 [Pseudomonadales bacterium]|nr:hypothetical protein [Pseudomonadales bacterium]NRA14005.1 hypothetical protein [Oceanospirillaceae bacterium]